MAKFNMTFSIEFIKDKLDAYSYAKEIEKIFAQRYSNKNFKLEEITVD